MDCVNLGRDAHRILYVVTDLVGDHMGLDGVADSGEALFHPAEELQIEVNPVIGRTVEWPGDRRSEAAGEVHSTTEQHQLGLSILCLAAGEGLLPGVLGIAEDWADELALLVAGHRGPTASLPPDDRRRTVHLAEQRPKGLHRILTHQ